MLLQEIAELTDMFFQPAIGHEATVPRKDLRLRQTIGGAVLVWVAKEELTRLKWMTRPRSRHVATQTFDRRQRKPITIAEMIVRILERRSEERRVGKEWRS